MLSSNGWEYVQRTNAAGIVVIVAVTKDDELVLVEQHRPPVSASVIELPAGLAGDIVGQEDEDLAVAAARELEEETGFVAAEMRPLMVGPTSAGMTDELISIFLATGLERRGVGGGDQTEDISVHLVSLGSVVAWLNAAQARGALVDPKIYAALFFAQHGR